MTPQQLKNSILQLAVQGKLVEQRKEEGTAEELYNVIQNEKKKLIEEGILKQSKVLHEISEDEIPYDIPESWKWVRLGDILDVRDGTHDSPKYVKEGFPLVTSKNLKNGIIDFSTCKYISEFDHLKISERSKVDMNDILFAMIGSIGNPVLVLTNEQFSIKNMALFKNISSIIDMKYVYWFLLFSQEIMKKQASGGVQSFVSLKFLREFLFSLPPLEEQKRIVEKIEEFLPLIERYDNAWTRLEELNKKFPLDMKKSILGHAIQGKLVEQRKEEGTGEELFKEIQLERIKLIEEGRIKKQKALPEISEEEIPFDIPENWKWVSISEICNIINGDRGKNYPSKDKLKKEGIPFISAINLDGTTVIDDEKLLCLTDEQYDKLGSGKLEQGDVVLCIRGSIGKHGRYPFEKGAIASSLVIVRPYLLDEYFIEYFMIYLDSFLFFSEVKKYDNGTAQPNLSATNLGKFLIPLPPLAEQKRIVEKIEEILPLCERLKFNN